MERLIAEIESYGFGYCVQNATWTEYGGWEKPGKRFATVVVYYPEEEHECQGEGKTALAALQAAFDEAAGSSHKLCPACADKPFSEREKCPTCNGWGWSDELIVTKGR